MMRNVPIEREPYRWQRKEKPPNVLRFTLILDGAVRVYPDGREVCQDNPQGQAEYKRRIQVMCQRQNFRCCLCPDRIYPARATFEHERLRRMAAAFRDDRIVDEKGKWMNGAAHWKCNRKKGSSRVSYIAA